MISDDSHQSLAMKRWDIVRSFVLRKAISRDDVSVRRVSSFGIIHSNKLKDVSQSNTMVKYSLGSLQVVLEQRKEDQVQMSDIIAAQKKGVDNTGNICLWPSEEVMSYWCMKHHKLFHGKTIVELGAGLGLASFMLLKEMQFHESNIFQSGNHCGMIEKLVISDGNPTCVNLLKKNLANNFSNHQVIMSKTEVKEILWHKYETYLELINNVDVIMAADCLFFKEYHIEFIQLLYNLLKRNKESQVFLFASKRGGTMDLFLKRLKDYQHVESHKNHFPEDNQIEAWKLDCILIEKYDDYVWLQHKKLLESPSKIYDPDIHYPILLKLQWKQHD